MTEIILHHYDASPYADKIRKTLGLKGLDWWSVIIPQIMPKPDLTALTGGYRMTPVMQIGANIYCDSQLIAKRLETEVSTPSLYPRSQVASIAAMESWAHELFLPAIVVLIGVGGIIPNDFLEDRNKIMPQPYSTESAKAATPGMISQIQVALKIHEQQLSDGREYLLGDQLTAADLALYVPLSTLFLLPPFAEMIEPYTRLADWHQRIANAPASHRKEMTSEEALNIAREAYPVIGATKSKARDHCKLNLGDRLRIMPVPLGNCPVEGELVQFSDTELVLLRRTETLGEIAVHFPRTGFSVEKIKA